jgi:hypothetical protein
MAALRWRKAATLAMIGVFAHHEPSTAHAVASSRGRLSLPGSTAYGGARARTPPATRRRAHRSSTVVLSAARSDEDSYGGADETSSDLDMEVLRRRMRRNRASTLSADDDGQVVGSAGGPEIYSPEDLASWEAETEDLHANLEYGWVLLFNAGTVEEGVYTVQDDDTTTFVLAFEDHEDATRFARQLEAEEFDLPTVSNWEMDILTEFCEADDFRIGWVPQGVRARRGELGARGATQTRSQTRSDCLRANPHTRTRNISPTLSYTRRSCCFHRGTTTTATTSTSSTRMSTTTSALGRLSPLRRWLLA